MNCNHRALRIVQRLRYGRGGNEIQDSKVATAPPTAEQMRDRGAIDGIPAMLPDEWERRHREMFQSRIAEARRHGAQRDERHSAANMARSKAVRMVGTDRVWHSLRAASAELGIPNGTMSAMLNGVKMPKWDHLRLEFA